MRISSAVRLATATSVEPAEPAPVGEQLAAGELLGQGEPVGQHAEVPLRADDGSFHTSIPSTKACPELGRSSPTAMDSAVVLPAPLGPTSP